MHPPPGLAFAADTAAADWVVRGQAPFDDPRRPWTVGHLVPAGFEAHARVFPPAWASDAAGESDDGGPRWRWSDIAARTGTPLTAATSWWDLSGLRPGPDGQSGRSPFPWNLPTEGCLEPPETTALAAVLARFTTTPDRAWFCVWDGHGGGVVQTWWERPQRVRTLHREYHLLTGPVSAATGLSEPSDFRSAAVWWPDDRAWLVATEIDGYNTFVGASAAAVEAVLAEPALEAVRTDRSVPLDPSWA